VGPLALAACVPWVELRELRRGDALWPRLLPPDAPLGGVPEARLDATGLRAFLHGQMVDAPGAARPGLARVYGPDGDFLGIGLLRDGRLKPERLLHADRPGTPVLPV
jgi:tRNA pseudouridine55 synthase